jgi:SAM-dependent methyltransferase
MALLQKSVDLIAERGVLGALAQIGRRIVADLDQVRPSQIRATRARARKDAEFDRALGVRTSGDARLDRLHIDGPNRRFGVCYRGIDPREFASAFSGLSIGHKDFTFVDLGAGKGRAMLLAAAHPYRRIIGVEFARELHGLAESNTRAFAATRARCPPFELVCGDAAAYDFPSEPLVVYLYNPFGAEVMAPVARRLLASHAAHPRPIYVVYANPFLADVWTRLGFVPIDSGDLHVVLTPP